MSKLAEATKNLPATAQREVKDLYDRYVLYTQAMKRVFPPEQQPENMTLQQAEQLFADTQKLAETATLATRPKPYGPRMTPRPRPCWRIRPNT